MARSIQRTWWGLALSVILAGGAFWLWPSAVDPAAYQPASGRQLIGSLAANLDLQSGQRLAEGQLRGPEDVALDSAGRIYAGCEDGRIVRLTLADDGSEQLETFADTGGRPLGLHFDSAGRLVVADARRGLLRIAPDGVIEVLATSADGVPFGFTDDLDIASDGAIYFSDASSRFGVDQYLFDLLEARPHGRLLRHDPTTGNTEVLLEGLYFANGVALAADESFVLVNETYRYRIHRYWLSGPRAGRSDIFIDRLPGFPDGISSDRRGTFWVAMFTVRNPRIDSLHPHPRLKRQLAKLPRALWPKPAPYGLVLALDEEGRITRSLHDPGGQQILEVTSVEEANGTLWLGNLHQDWIGRVPTPPLPDRVPAE